jgi:hypothetical protein
MTSRFDVSGSTVGCYQLDACWTKVVSIGEQNLTTFGGARRRRMGKVTDPEQEDGAGAAAAGTTVCGHPAPMGYARYQASKLSNASTRVEAPVTTFQVTGPLTFTVTAKCARRPLFPMPHLLPS